MPSHVQHTDRIESFEPRDTRQRVFSYHSPDVPPDFEGTGWENKLLGVILAWFEANPMFKIEAITFDGDIWFPPEHRTAAERTLATLGFRDPPVEFHGRAVVYFADVEAKPDDEELSVEYVAERKANKQRFQSVHAVPDRGEVG